MRMLLWVCAGGAVGSGLRYLVAHALNPPDPGAFPWGTLAVNVLGSFAISLLLGTGELTPTARAALVTGVLGGFTTYSAFNQDTLRLLHGSSPLTGVLYLLATVGGCLLAGLAGGLLARR